MNNKIKHLILEIAFDFSKRRNTSSPIELMRIYHEIRIIMIHPYGSEAVIPSSGNIPSSNELEPLTH